MWHVKLINVNIKQYEIIKNLLGDEIYFQTFEINGQDFKEYYLILESQDIKSAPEALSIGKDKIIVLSSILKLFEVENNISVNIPYEIHEDGTRTGFMTFIDTIKVTEEVKIYSNNQLIYSTEENIKKAIGEIYTKCITSDIKKKLIIYLGKEKNWINAYKIYEILKHEFIDEKELKKIPELSTFAHTANSPHAIGEKARHGIQKHDNPKTIANFEASYNKLKELAIKFLSD